MLKTIFVIRKNYLPSLTWFYIIQHGNGYGCGYAHGYAHGYGYILGYKTSAKDNMYVMREKSLDR